ncbi:lysosome-associated membrane glycoprotein 1 [Lithobates pipiens]
MRRMETAGHRRLWEAVLAMALVLGFLQSASCVRFEVKDSANKTCILADLSVNFTVEYTAGTKQATASFGLPGNSLVGSNSTCDKGKAPLLVIVFGNHSLSINFTNNDVQYQVDELVFTYNLSDKAIFPDASENGTKEVATNKSEMIAKKNFVYHCINPHQIHLENVNLTFYDVKLEAYLNNSTYSKDESRCSEDTTPTRAPTSAPTSAPAPSPTTVPVKNPETGEYRVNDSTGAACLLAKAGLQLNLTYLNSDGKVVFKEININPKNISVDGKCLNGSASLILFDKELFLSFNFTLNTTVSKFYLGEVIFNTTIDAKAFRQENGSLLYLQTTERKSYKCNSKQTFQITSNFSIDTYNLQMQAFDINANKFGPAVECAEDQNGMLVPIVVGAALAGLVLIVLIAYLIGRRRSHAGYQTI